MDYLLLNNKGGGDTQFITDKSQNNYAQWKKPDKSTYSMTPFK